MNVNRHRRSKGRYAKTTHRIRNTFAGIVATFVTLGIIGACGEDAPAESGYVPCVTEDADGPCYWDASERGNGVGRDFIVTPDNAVLYDVPLKGVK